MPATETPPAPTTDDWARVEAAGVLRVGSPLDNAPFNTYNSAWEPDGFDVALMTELVKRLGLKVEFKDIVFGSLLDTLELGRIDAVIAAMAVTDERQQAADFTSPYYQGEDIGACRAGIVDRAHRRRGRPGRPHHRRGARHGVRKLVEPQHAGRRHRCRQCAVVRAAR